MTTSQRVRGEGNPRFGLHCSEETKAKISAALLANPTLKGRRQSPEHIAKIIATRQAKPKLIHMLICKNCGATFTHKDKRTLTCSRKCHLTTIRQARPTYSSRPTKPKVCKICLECGTEFISQYGEGHKYCSVKCRNLAMSKRFSGAGNPLYGIGHTEATKAKMRANHYDSSGAKNGRWLGGKSFEPYTWDFSKRLRELIRKRDNYKCQVCHTKQNGRRLNIHHIDYIKKHNAPNNLIALCDLHHTRTNSDRDFWQRYFNRPHRKASRRIKSWLMTTT